MAEPMDRPPVKKRRHRFQKVDERVGNLHSELQLHAKTNALLDDASALSFKEELGLQAELTTLDSFQRLMRKLQPLVTTTPQLLHHLPKVVALLRVELQEARETGGSSDSDLVVQRQRLVPVLKLVTALARELRQEFYPHFAGVLPFVVAVVDTKDPELSTQVFKTLTMLFNYLRVQLLADMAAVHQCYFPLLGHPRDFVREFAAQTLAVLLRRLDSPKALRKYLRAYLRALTRGSGKDDAVLRDGSAKLFLALVRNVNRGFHSRMRDVLLFLLAAFRPKHQDDQEENKEDTNEDKQEQRKREEAVFEIVRQTCELLTKHTDPEHAGEMLDCLTLAVTKVAAQRPSSEASEADDLYLSRLLRIVLYFMLSRIGKLVTDVDAETRVACVHRISAALLAADASALTSPCVQLRDMVVQLLETVWRLFPAPDALLAAQTSSFFQVASNAAVSNDVRLYWRHKLLAFVEQVLHNAYVEVRFVTTFVVPNALGFALRTLVKEDVGAFSSLLCQVGSYVAAHEAEMDVDDCQFLVVSSGSGHALLSFEAVDAEADAVLLEAGRQVFKQCRLTAEEDKDEQDHDVDSLALGWKFCKALAQVRMDGDKLKQLVMPVIAQCDRRLAHDASASCAVPLGALRAELWRLQQIAEHEQDLNAAQDAIVVTEVLHGKEASFATLSALLEFMEMKTEAEQHALLTTQMLADVGPSLFATLRSPAHELRLVALELLARFERLSFRDDGNDAALSGPCDLLDVAVDLERTCASLTVQNEREVVRLLTRVKVLCRSPQTPTLYKQAAVNHLLGLYHVKFAIIWPHVADAVEAAARLHFAELWPFISAELLAASIRPDDSVGKLSKGKTHRKTTVVAAETRDKSAIEAEFERVCALERGQVAASSSTDAATHHTLLWKGLAKFSELVESKTRFMVPLFLAFLRDQYALIYVDELDARRLAEIDEALVKVDEKDTQSDPQWREKREFSVLTTKGVRTKFIDQLKLFATFRNMKGAYAQGLLHALLFELLMKSDELVSKLALQCLLCFGSKALAAYKTQLNRLADSASFREELTSFKVDKASGVVLQEHRAELLPVLLRLLYSKCVSKKGRNSGDTVAARRAAILAYLAALDTHELAIFVELVVRAFEVPVPVSGDAVSATEVKPVEMTARVQPSRILGFLNLLEDLVGQLGVKLTAFVPPLADVLLSILQISASSSEEETGDDTVEALEDEKDKEEDEESAAVVVGSKRRAEEFSTSSGVHSSTSMASTSAGIKKQIRMLTYRRLAEIIDTFDTLVSLKPWVMVLLETSREAIEHLPGAVVGADKASALLDVLVALGRADRASQWLPKPFVLSVISCLSTGLATPSAGESASSSRGITPEILDAVLQFMGSLLDGDDQILAAKDGDDAMSDATTPTNPRSLMLVPHIPFVLAQFVLRFQAKAARYASDRYAGSSRKELSFLCRLSQHLDANAGDVANAAHDLFQLLLPFLLRSHHTSPGDKENLLQVLAHLVPKLSEPKKHVLALARLLAPGPNCITDRAPREKLVLVFTALGEHVTLRDLAPVAELLKSLNAYDAKAIEEPDVERRMVALNSLTTSRFSGFTGDAYLLAPLVAQTLQCMHDRDFSVRSAALAALTGFLALAADVAVQQKDEEASKSPVLNALESLVLPCIRSSVRSTSEDARRGFVTLLGALADRHEAFVRFPFVPADLILARNREDPEADFFYNITHIQAHRKRRALQRLGALMDDMAVKAQQAEAAGEEATTAMPQWFSNSTVNSILLPLVLHFIYEAQAKSQESLRTEAAACVGSAAGLLGWSHYLALLRRLLKSIDGHAEMEAAIILSICAVVDHFHFEAPGAATHWKASTSRFRGKKNWKTKATEALDEETEEDDGEGPSKVQESMETQVLPMLHRYLFKGVGSKSGGGLAKTQDKDKDDDGASSLTSEAVAVRVPLALAAVKVLRRLRAATFHRELPKLLLRFATLLKSKDEAVRASARSTLVKMAVELGARFLLPIVQELRHTLRDGYMVHVLSFTVHSLLEKLPAMLAADEAGPPRRPKSLLAIEGDAEQEDAFTSPLDACVPSLMDILAAELFQGMTSADEAAEAAAGGVERNKARKSKMKEARASGGRGLDSLELLARALPFLPNPSIHEVVGALVRRFRDTDAGAQASAALQEALKRVALGLTKNAAVEPSYVFLYAYNVLDACLESLRPATEREKARYEAAGTNTQLVTSWLVSEKSAAATKLLAARVNARDAARVTMHQQATGFDKLRQQEESRNKRRTPVDAASESTAHLEELLNFAVFVVFSFLRSGAKETDKKTTTNSLASASAPAQLVDPLVPLLMRCAGEAKHDRVVMNSLKCLGALLPRNEELPALRVARTPLVERLFKILQKAGAATRNEMVQTCYRTLTSLLKQQQGLELAQQDGDKPATDKKDTLRLTEPQLRVLLSFLSADLDAQDHANATYALLKAIVGARLVVSEVYDVMLRVGELLVQSDAAGARANCASIYLTFLLEYPLGPKRLARHLKFLVDNLSYGHATGRAAVLEALRALLSRLPQDLVNARAQFFLLPLVLRVANDEAPECRELARVVLATLVRRLGNKELNESVLLLASWWSQTAATAQASTDAAKLLATAAQVSTLVLETRPEFLERNAPQVFRSARTALEQSLETIHTAAGSQDVCWQTPYHVCVALTAFSEHLTGPFEAWLEGADEDATSKKKSAKKPKQTPSAFLDVVALPLLEYPHAWVRLAASKLLGSYLRRRRAATLAFASPVKRLSKNVLTRSKNGARYLQQPGRLFAWASALCKLLEAPALDDELANEVLAALPFLCEALEAFPDIPQDISAAADATKPSEVEEADMVEKADEDTVEEEDSDDKNEGGDEDVAKEDEQDVDAEQDEAEAQRRTEQEQVARTPVGWLLTRLSYVARGASRREAVQVVVFKLFAALLHSHDAGFAQTYVVQFMNPLYRASSALRALQAQQEVQQTQKQQRGRRKGPAPEPIAPPESALLAQEVLELLERKLGPTAFLESYSFVQRKLASARATRKRQRQAEAVADPQRAAQRRMHKNEQKRHTKQMRKRKHTVFKGTASAATRPSKVQRPGAE